MASFTITRFIAVLVLVAISWNVITACDEFLDNLYFNVTGAKQTDPKHWFIIALIGIVILAIMLRLINMDLADLLGVAVRPGLNVKF